MSRPTFFQVLYLSVEFMDPLVVAANSEFPFARTVSHCVGRRVDADGFDARINGLSELRILDETDRFARKRGQALALPRLLHSAFDHSKAQRLDVHALAFLPIHGRV